MCSILIKEYYLVELKGALKESIYCLTQKRDNRPLNKASEDLLTFIDLYILLLKEKLKLQCSEDE